MKIENEDHTNIQKEGRPSDVYHLSGMYQDWFLDYASYVILERAVPHIDDGLKPVQRRILHSMKRLDDGRYNKVANIVGHTMQFHPHGDASIGDALVQLGQKDLLVDCQGNWGNILTGDGAAASRYIEARLSGFALETVFNPKTTQWQASYDGRNKEPVTLPIKFPLLLMQGVEGIAVGLSSKILPHNFNELIDASIAYLKKKPFKLYPDFQTGGFIDVSKYNDGERGGSVKIRAKIIKKDSKTLVITDIPYGRTTSSVIDSILKANDKGKIKIKRVDDNTAQNVEILVHLGAGVSSDKTIDALYAFTDCEISISPNCCVIRDNKPCFLKVSEVLCHNIDHTLELLRRELEIRKAELDESLLFASLEKIFMEEQIYKDKEFENASDMKVVLNYVYKCLEPYKPTFYRPITDDDILHLLEIKMQRILKFNSKKSNDLIRKMKEEMKKVDYNLAHIVNYTVNWFRHLKKKYGSKFVRKTELRDFITIEATKVVEANEKLYINRKEGFVGTSLKKDEFICNCSSIDDLIIFYRTGLYKVVKVSEKMFVGKDVLFINVFKRNDTRTIYNVVYRDGRPGGIYYIKRFAITSILRDKEYDITKGTKGSRIFYFSANPNGEAEVIKITLKLKIHQKIESFDKDFSEIGIKNKKSIGNILTKAEINRISLKAKGVSTLGGLRIWFDWDVLRLNTEKRGKDLGEFQPNDMILVVYKDGKYETCNLELTNHFDEGIQVIERFDPHKLWTAVYWNAKLGYTYIKRFTLVESKKMQELFTPHKDNYFYLLTDTLYPRLNVKMGGSDDFRDDLLLDVEAFCPQKSYKARGKRLTNYEVATVTLLEPVKKDDNTTLDQDDSSIEETEKEDENKNIEGKQMNLFN